MEQHTLTEPEQNSEQDPARSEEQATDTAPHEASEMGQQSTGDAAAVAEHTEVPEANPQPPDQTPESRKARRKEIVRRVLTVSGIAAAILLLVLLVAYIRMARWVDKQLASGPFQRAYDYYAAGESITPGDQISVAEAIDELRHAGLRDGAADQPHTFTATRDTIVVRTSPPVRIEFSGNQVRSITEAASHKPLDRFDLPAGLITNSSGNGRTQRIIVHYADLPPVLIHAIISAEDKRFFKHGGIDVLRLVKAFYVDLKDRRKEQGASTITMQLARNLYLDHGKEWKRKIAESMITLHLEHKLTKQQILEYYCNVVYLGGNGAFAIEGFGEAARAFFNKDIQKLSLTEAATLAGLIQRPSSYNPLRYPERAVERRNAVLALMRDNNYITPSQYQEAVQYPLGLDPGINDIAQTQYFLDLAGDRVSREMNGQQEGSAAIYTTIDIRLQKAAEQAVHDGMALVDKQLRLNGAAPPQVALIAIDPHTGDVKALVGGRDYTTSQVNRVLSKRPPGSVFKPFVYTAAINSALEGGNPVFTPASTIMDSATTIEYDHQTYSPNNFKGVFMGQVTLRQALAHSLNNATVKLAQTIGFDKVVALARRAGLNDDIKPTPSVALGAYQVSPLEIASTYTIFANGGVRVAPNFIRGIRDRDGDSMYEASQNSYVVLDPRVAFIMTDMLKEVLRSGTGAGVRARGFNLEAAGKTGTSHDGWFAGYTSQLLCVVWVGFDDYRELGLEGARSALPIWTEFMMNAARYADYRNVKKFVPPAGVVSAPAGCESDLTDYFIEGTQPSTTCPDSEIPHAVFPPPGDGQPPPGDKH